MNEQIYTIDNVESFELRDIFECGQCFRWNLDKQDNSYTGIVGKNVLNIKKEQNKIIVKGYCTDNIKDICNNYFDLTTNYEKIKINKKNIDKLILNNKINFKKINIIFNKINKYSINKKIIKNIFKQFNIIGEINLNNYCNYLINKKNNYKNENKKLIKQYLKIIKQINK